MDIMRLNKLDTAPGLFPYNQWQILLIGSDAKDGQQARLHVFGGGWNVVFGVADGRLISIDAKGDEQTYFDYIWANINKWLDTQSNFTPQFTNRKMALIMCKCIDDWTDDDEDAEKYDSSPKIGLFWLDINKTELLCALKVNNDEHSRRNTNNNFNISETHRQLWDKMHEDSVARNDDSSPFYNYQNYKQFARCRVVCYRFNQYDIAVGDWYSSYPIENELRLRNLIINEFNIPYDFDFVIDETLNLNREWSESE